MKPGRLDNGPPHLYGRRQRMTAIEKEKIRYLRGEGLGYKAIASRLVLSENAVKGFCKRNGLDGIAAENADDICRQCGAAFEKKPGAEKKKFCSGKCRSAWWRQHDYLSAQKEENKRVCAYCNRPFFDCKSADRKYCGRSCYMAARFGGERP